MFTSLISLTLLAASATSTCASPVLHKRYVNGGTASQVTWSWGNTSNLFVFGDSYSTTGWNISAPGGTNLTLNPSPQDTSSNGPNWVSYLNSTYNVLPMKTYNLAYGGATIDSNVVVPYLPTVQSLVEQVALFKQYLSPPPASAPWTGDNSLFAIWIGINDIGNSFGWTNVSQPAFHKQLITEYFGLVDQLYSEGARNFLFLNVPPVDRAANFAPADKQQVALQIQDYNNVLETAVANFTYNAPGVATTYFDTNALFDLELANAGPLGWMNTTGYCPAYANGTPMPNSYIAGCAAPVSNYFWLNTLHPTWPLHNILAHAITGAFFDTYY